MHLVICFIATPSRRRPATHILSFIAMLTLRRLRMHLVSIVTIIALQPARIAKLVSKMTADTLDA
jgi:hypothetical protein